MFPYGPVGIWIILAIAIFASNFSITRLKENAAHNATVQSRSSLENNLIPSQYLNPTRLKRGIILFTHSSTYYSHQAAIKLAKQGYYVLLPRPSPNNPHNIVRFNTHDSNSTGTGSNPDNHGTDPVSVSDGSSLSAEDLERKRKEYHQYFYMETNSGRISLEKQLVRGIELIDPVDFSSPVEMNELYVHLFQLQHKLDAPVKAIVFNGMDFMHDAMVQADALTSKSKMRASRGVWKGYFLSRQVNSRYVLPGRLVDTAANSSMRENLHVHGVKTFVKFLEGLQEALVPTLNRGMVPLLLLVDNPLLLTDSSMEEETTVGEEGKGESVGEWMTQLHALDGGLLDGYRMSLAALRDTALHMQRKYFNSLRKVMKADSEDLNSSDIAIDEVVVRLVDGQQRRDPARELRRAEKEALVKKYQKLTAQYSPLYRVAVLQESPPVPAPGSGSIAVVGNDTRSVAAEVKNVVLGGPSDVSLAVVTAAVSQFLQQHYEDQVEFPCGQLDKILDLRYSFSGNGGSGSGSSEPAKKSGRKSETESESEGSNSREKQTMQQQEEGKEEGRSLAGEVEWVLELDDEEVVRSGDEGEEEREEEGEGDVLVSVTAEEVVNTSASTNGSASAGANVSPVRLPLYNNDPSMLIGTLRDEAPLVAEAVEIVVRINAPPDYQYPVRSPLWTRGVTSATTNSVDKDNVEEISLLQWFGEHIVRTLIHSYFVPAGLKSKLPDVYMDAHSALSSTNIDGHVINSRTLMSSYTSEEVEEWYQTLLPLYQLSTLCVRNSYDPAVALEQEYIAEQSGVRFNPRHRIRRKSSTNRKSHRSTPLLKKKRAHTKRDNYQSKKSYNPYSLG